MKKKYSEAIQTVKNSSYGNGRDIANHLLEGSHAYKMLFFEIMKLIEKHGEEGFWIYKKELLKRAKIPCSASMYPLYKFEKEDYIRIKSGVVYVDVCHLENWEVLCEVLGSRGKT